MAISFRYLYQKTCASSAGSVVACFAIGMRVQRASLCHAPARRARSLLHFISQSQENWNGRQDADGQEGQTGAASFIFCQTVAEEKTDPHSQRASCHRDEPNLRQRQSDAFCGHTCKLFLSLIRIRRASWSLTRGQHANNYSGKTRAMFQTGDNPNRDEAASGSKNAAAIAP